MITPPVVPATSTMAASCTSPEEQLLDEAGAADAHDEHEHRPPAGAFGDVFEHGVVGRPHVAEL